MGKKWMILLISFSALTLVSSVISIILISKFEQNRSEMNTNGVLATKNIYQKTIISYFGDNEINIDNLSTDNPITKKFTVTNSNSNTLKYKISLEDVSTNIDENEANSFAYSLTCTNSENKSTNLPLSSENIAENLELRTNQSNDCTITISLVGEKPSSEFEKTYTAKYKVIIEEGALE